MIDLTPYTDSNGDIDLKKELIQNLAGIVTSGSNPQGSYVRFSDGTQICYIESFLVPYNDKNSLFGTWTFPASFYSAGAPVLATFNDVAIERRGKMTLFTRNATTTRSQVLIGTAVDVFVVGDVQSCKLIAIGRWK